MITSTRLGQLHTTSDADMVGRALRLNGEWAWDEVVFLASILPEQPRILDAGACFGTFGLGLAALRNAATVCFVEANPALLPLLRANAAAHAQGRGVVVEALLAPEGAQPRAGRARAGNMGSGCFLEEADGPIEVDPPARAVTLSVLRAEYGPFHLIKLDIEGFELAVLTDDAAFLARGETAVWVECNNEARSLDVAALLLSWNVALFYFAFPSHNPDNANGNAVPVFPMAYEAGLLAAPRGTPTLSADLVRHGCVLRPINEVEDLRSAMWHTPRWGLPGWDAADKAALAALAGHHLRGERYDDYLKPGWRPGALLDERLAEAEAALAQAHALGAEHLAALHTEQGTHTLTFDAFLTAQRLAFEYQAAAMREHAALVEATEALKAADARLQAQGRARWSEQDAATSEHRSCAPVASGTAPCDPVGSLVGAG